MRTPSPRTTTRAFWSAFASIGALLLLIEYLDGRGPHVTDSYAIGIGALLPMAVAVLYALSALLFALIRWRPFRLAMAATACLLAAWLCLAATWFI